MARKMGSSTFLLKNTFTADCVLADDDDDHHEAYFHTVPALNLHYSLGGRSERIIGA